MTARSPALRLRIGLFVAAIALLPGIIAIIAAGVGGAPTSGLVIAEATGAFSLVALQGLDRRAFDAPTGSALVAVLEPAPPFDPMRVGEVGHACDDDTARTADADARVLPLRL